MRSFKQKGKQYSSMISSHLVTYYTIILLYYYTIILLYYYTIILLYYYTIILLYYERHRYFHAGGP